MSARAMRGVRTVVTILCTAPALLAAQDQFRARTDLVHVPVIVTGKRGDLVRGLTAADFDVREDGQPQKIAFFSEGAPGAELPLHLGLLLDTSESMTRDLADAQSAAVQFVDALEEPADVTFVDFDTTIRLARFQPASYPLLFERIRERKASGMTALYDALGIYLQSADGRDGQHVLVVYTDGGDSSSSMTAGKLSELLKMSTNVLVYAIGYLENQSSSSRMMQQIRITQIARDTGGDAFFPGTAPEIHQIYAKILDELLSRYTIGYTSSNPRTDGKYRKIQVRLVRPDLKDAKVRSRPGYYAPK